MKDIFGGNMDPGRQPDPCGREVLSDRQIREIIDGSISCEDLGPPLCRAAFIELQSLRERDSWMTPRIQELLQLKSDLERGGLFGWLLFALGGWWKSRTARSEE